MKILKKREIAVFIDTLTVGIIHTVGIQVLETVFKLSSIGTILNVILITPIFFKDLVFKNASIGKKIMGIAIYDDKWNKPNAKQIIKRSLLMMTYGFVLFWKTIFVGESKITLFDWERETLKTRVIDKKILKEFEQMKAKDKTVDIDQMYNQYLMSLYSS